MDIILGHVRRFYKILLVVEALGALAYGSSASYQYFFNPGSCEKATVGNSHAYLFCYAEQSSTAIIALYFLTAFLGTLFAKRALKYIYSGQ